MEVEETGERAPAELWLECTDADGRPAEWFHDLWWTEVLSRWGDLSVTVHVLPTPGALLHAVVVSAVEMVRRVAPRWRVVGHAYVDELGADAAVEALARSAYHEVRLIDQPRSTCRGDRSESSLTLPEFLGRVRREQERLGVTRPILTRVADAPAGNSGGASASFGSAGTVVTAPVSLFSR
ncbi:MAG TPA: hypothetical protein PKK06_06155 [Phycisphaerae bacterium]|nr:hypothetical protein [Phycisphaerae bacterium]HNU44223.1 hypothetical protein [Phycisphaerae bacterium]